MSISYTNGNARRVSNNGVNGSSTAVATGNRTKDKKNDRRNCDHVLVWDQKYRDTSVVDDESKCENGEENLHRPNAVFGSRHMVTFMLFLGMANAYVMRTNMSVAIVAMVNHSALPVDESIPKDFDECGAIANSTTGESADANAGGGGTFVWSSIDQGHILTAFFYGYVVTQIPFGILSKKYGAKYFLGIGMLINSLFAFLVPLAANHHIVSLCGIRFIQGLGEGPIVPCTHAILAKWIPPNERSRMGAFVYAGAQFGTIISMPLSGVLAEYGFAGGWPSIFYVFGLVGTIWSILFLFVVYEDPNTHPSITEQEKKYINLSVWGTEGMSKQSVPWKDIVTSMPFWAILIAHMGQNYGYETLLTQLPTYMNQILHFEIKSNGLYSAMPYLAMWLFSMLTSVVADVLISSKKYSITTVRKLINSIGQYGPAVALIFAAYTGCDRFLTVAILTIGVGLNGAIYSGFKVNHLDISPRLAGILMSFTNCLANFSGLLAPNVVGRIVDRRPTHAAWRAVFFVASIVYIFSSTFYLLFASGDRQPWDDKRTADEKNSARRKNEEANGKYAINVITSNGSTLEQQQRNNNHVENGDA